MPGAGQESGLTAKAQARADADQNAKEVASLQAEALEAKDSAELRGIMKRQMALAGLIHSELEECAEFLNATAAGAEGSLLDKEGFPRADCDVWNVRIKRNRRSVLTTDHKQIMKDIDANLERVAEMDRGEGKVEVALKEAEVKQRQKAETEANEQERLLRRVEEQGLGPFLTVHSVTPDSPAQEAGLQPQDGILCFGTVTQHCPIVPLQQVAQLVQSSVDQKLDVIVERGVSKTKKALQLWPHKWSGKGLLGCVLTPV